MRYDILIIGGGMVGASLALALGGRALRIGLVEAVPASAAAQPSYDDRCTVLSYGTRQIFTGIGLWNALHEEAVPIQQIHVSERGRLGVTRIDCREEGVAALGYVVANRLLGRVLVERLAALENVDVYCPAKLFGLSIDAANVGVKLRLPQRTCELKARLLVAADGANSSVREQLRIPARHRDYGQAALIANLTPELDHQNVAYERFTDTGPIALLPLSGRCCALIWTVPHAEAQRLLALDEREFFDRLEQRFGHRLGKLERVGKRQAYPLALICAQAHRHPRVVLIGNAAHSLHPVAGQGFNLGLRDVAALAELILEASDSGHDPGSAQVLKRYSEWRQADQRRVIAFTDTLVRLFSNAFAPLSVARSLGLLALDLTPCAKRALARQSMGLTGRLPRLARGLPLR
jgi:2-polyprenyl-6-methoxyphenol 4-hydroxylase